MTPQKRRVDGSLVADELCLSPTAAAEQLSLGPRRDLRPRGRARPRAIGFGRRVRRLAPAGDGGGGAHRILQLGLNLAADEKPLISALGTTTRVESVAFLQGNACSYP